MFGRKKKVVIEYDDKKFELVVGSTLTLYPTIEINGSDVWGTLHVDKGLNLKVVEIK